MAIRWEKRQTSTALDCGTCPGPGPSWPPKNQVIGTYFHVFNCKNDKGEGVPMCEECFDEMIN